MKERSDFHAMEKGTLFIVSTPIGNLQDITARALSVLKEADFIAAEDTRHTKKLLNHYGISTPLKSCFEHNEQKKALEFVERLLAGASVALVSDAGTPGISDPGFRLVKLAIERGVKVVAVPGPSAIIAALSVSGFSLSSFTFLGFVSAEEAERKRLLLSLTLPEHTFIMFEAARRLKQTLSDIEEILGKDIDVVVAREMTKVYEDVLRGKVSDVIHAVKDKELKGEVTLIARTGKRKARLSGMDEEIERLLSAGFSIKDAARAVSVEFEVPKGAAYKEALKVKAKLK
ncbi:MAG: 16S rRNA (cytidine(1402)-2'-O)-methyltransferase [Deltaproteobacteria bacterium]